MTNGQTLLDAAGRPGTIPVDPFDFFRGVASRISGLGGTIPAQDPYYVFHTPYYEASPGPGRFIIQFHGLAARRGTLWLRVHMLPMEPGAHAVLANSDRIQLNRLIQAGGRAEIQFEGFRGMSFGLYAGIQDDTDAQADGVQVWLDRPFDPNEQMPTQASGRTTAYGTRHAKPSALMLSTESPSLSAPTSQIATATQLTDPSWERVVRQVGSSFSSVTEGWQHAAILQALRCYGMLEPGAIGLGITQVGDALADTIRSSGPQLQMVRPAAERVPSPQSEVRSILLDPIPDDLVNFDFLWSMSAWDILAGPAQAIRFIEAAMAALCPGGLAVHCGAYRLGDRSAGAGAAIGRKDVERLLLILISRGHEVAQFKIDEIGALNGADGETGAVMIIARKAASLI